MIFTFFPSISPFGSSIVATPRCASLARIAYAFPPLDVISTPLLPPLEYPRDPVVSLIDALLSMLDDMLLLNVLDDALVDRLPSVSDCSGV